MQDNLDAACAAIEKAAMERVIQLRSGQPFWDPSVPHTTLASSLPDALRVKPSGIQLHQIAVYEDFSEFSKIPLSFREAYLGVLIRC